MTTRLTHVNNGVHVDRRRNGMWQGFAFILTRGALDPPYTGGLVRVFWLTSAAPSESMPSLEEAKVRVCAIASLED